MDKQSSSSSKVTVEYHDPAGVFPLIAPGLNARLPLRHLHWNSQSRPLRSISSLHVELVPSNENLTSTTSQADAPSDQTQADPQTAASRPASSGNASHRTGSGPEQHRGPGSTRQTTAGGGKERRHQIPGLRQTPYLKIYLLRCDDSETYKASSRKLLREWIKAHTRPTQSTTAVNTQDNHDAFEWLILHVVIPGTPAASQSRWSAGGGGGNTTDKGAGGSRFLGKSSSTLLEKISADFNGSGKAARDRTAQVRLRKEDLPHSAQSQMPAQTTAYDDEQQERSSDWDDVMSKVKALILTSFDLRVTQYEEDIREKDSQRKLPGWNFCTFFVLKEGLARGFESVGLVEDALTGYDELALGLDTVVREQTSDGSGDHQGATFLDHTEELLQEAQLALRTANDDHADAEKQSAEADIDVIRSFRQRPGSYPLDANKKHYRELILANNISIFDFQCYIFTRQLFLLLRLGHGLSSEPLAQEPLRLDNVYDQVRSAARGDVANREAMRKAGEAENSFALAEVCRRALEFITSVSRTMRSDLLKGLEHDSNDAENGDRQRIGGSEQVSVLVENIASSWAFSVCQQVLEQTATFSVEYLLSFKRVHTSVGSGDDQSISLNESTTGSERKLDTLEHPARKSSLPSPSPQTTMTLTSESKPSSTVHFDDGLRISRRATPMPPAIMKPGAESLVTSRAELYLLARRILSHLGQKCDWTLDYTGRSPLSGAQIDSELKEVPLAEDDTNMPQTGILVLPSSPVVSIKCIPLQLALEDKETFYRLYEFLTQESIAHFEVASKTKSVQKCTADLAMMKFHLGDYATAASYFHHIAPFYAEAKWDLLEVSILTIYAHCLKKLGRMDDYVRVILRILGKKAAEAVGSRWAEGALGTSGQESSDTAISSNPSSSIVGTTEFAADLLSHSAGLHREISAPMSRYMRNIRVSPFIRHYDDMDGFQLQLSFWCMLGDCIPIQGAKVKIISTDGGPVREIWLESDETITLRPGPIKVWLHSNVNVYGLYSVTKILLRCQRINFVHDLQPQKETTRSLSIQGEAAFSGAGTEQASQVFCYSRASALEAQLSPSNLIHLERSRSIEISVRSGWNDILEGEIRIRAASAGLRLHIAETVSVGDSIISQVNSQSGAIEFQHLSPGSSGTLRIPYASESELNELSLKIEVSYKTEKGHFFYASNPSISIVLPLGVNVQDSFKEHMLVSRFTVSTVTSVPLRMVSSTLEGSSLFDAMPASPLATGVNILKRQPASLIFRITKKGDSELTTMGEEKLRASLSLCIEYACIDEEVTLSVEARFLEAIKGSPFEDLSCLLLPVLLRGVRSKLTVTELEAATLVQEFDLGPFEAMFWPRTLIWLPSDAREPVYQWLRGWHEANKVMSLSENLGLSSGRRSNRRIIIPVEIPSVSIVHTVKIRLLPADGSGQSSVALAAVGQILAGALEIKHTRRWDTANVREVPPPEEDESRHFSYEVQANPDSWLVAGRRKGHFRAKENEVLSFPIAMLPQRTGYLLYPTVEIRALAHRPEPSDRRRSAGERESRSSSGGLSAGASPPPHCETDYRNQADVILVLPNLKSSTVGLDGVGAGGTAWPVESERRVEATMSSAS